MLWKLIHFTVIKLNKFPAEFDAITKFKFQFAETFQINKRAECKLKISYFVVMVITAIENYFFFWIFLRTQYYLKIPVRKSI